VVSAPEYTKWVASQKQAMAAAGEDAGKTWELKDLVARGEKVYAANCVACHQANGQGLAAMKAPALAGSKFITGPEEAPIDTVLNGRPNTAMQAFKQQLSDTEIAAVVSFARNAWGNKASDVQPAEVKARRK
jgi:cytochrome c oxidase subunit 2